MSIQIKFPPGNERYDASSAVSMAVLLIFIASPLVLLEFRIRNACELSFSLLGHNKTIDRKLFDCSISYDQCRCAGSSNKFGLREECITDVEAMAGHVLPLIIYGQALYLFYNLVSFTGKYRHILTDIFWIIALVIFVIIAIAVHGSSCSQYYTAFIISITGVLLGMVPLYLFCRVKDQYMLRATGNTNPDQRPSTDNSEHDLTITFTLF